MHSRKNSIPIYKMSDFASIPFLDLETGEDEFVVRLAIPNIRHEILDRYFRSNFFMIFLVTKGETMMSINLKEYKARKNSIIFMAPNDLKRNIFTDKPAEVAGIAFTANFLTKSGLAKQTSDVMSYFSTQISPLWELKRQEANMIRTLLLQLAQRSNALNEHPFGTELLYASFQIFMFEMGGLSKKYAKAGSTYLSRKETLVMNFTRLVQKQFRWQRSINRYASQLNITPKYLMETVKEISGKTAGEIVDDFVVQESITLLSNNELSIAEIADELHFSDQSFFGKFFKRHTGKSPKEYRKSLH